jgi:hypothetical protein
MSKFVPPDKDEEFRDLIMVLQKEMGDAPTGVLTSDQFNLLSDAANDIEERWIAPDIAKFVTMKDGTLLMAGGTGAMDDIADPINKVQIVCTNQDAICEFTEATIDLEARLLSLNGFIYYDINTWTSDRVTAIREHPCGTATMTIDVKSQNVTIMGASHGSVGACLNNKPSIWTLTDGFSVAWSLNQKRAQKARKLLYEPARKFWPQSTQ